MNDFWNRHWRTIKAHLVGPVGSVLLHVVLVILLISFAVEESNKTPAAVEVTMMEARADKVEIEKEPPKPIEKIETPVQPPDMVERPDVATVNAIDIPSDTPDATGTGVGNQDGVGIGSGDASLGQGFEVAMSKSPLVMRGLYANRTAGGRGGAIRRYGGTGRGEDAVIAALRWLKANQDEDGSWTKIEGGAGHAGGSQNAVLANVGLALLCYLAHNETPSSPEFGKTVEKAMKYLVEKQSGNGCFGGGSGQQWAYTHGICTYAICESFGLTKIMALKDSMDKAVAFMIQGQQPTGGFNYGYEKGARWDLSVSGWQFQALKAAKMAGCTHEQLEEAIRKSLEFLKKEAFSSGGNGFGYSGTPGQQGNSASWTMTGAGTLCMQLLGMPNAPEVKAGVAALANQTCAWNADKNPVYGWYYVTQAKFQKGGKDWTDWNAQFNKALVDAQIVEMKDKVKLGHWEKGDWSPGPVYTTTFCVLMLEVYYRFLPTFQQATETAVAAEPAKPKSGDDVVVDIR